MRDRVANPLKFLLGAMLDKMIANFLQYTVHSGQLHTSLKHLLGPVVQYKDIQTSFVFLLGHVTFRSARKMKLLVISAWTTLICFINSERISRVIIYSLVIT